MASRPWQSGWPRPASWARRAGWGGTAGGRKARQQRLQVEAAAPHQQGHPPAPVFGGDGGLGQLGELLQVDRLIGIAQVQQFVAHPAPLGGGGFGGAHLHAAVELARIHRQHGQVEGFGQGDGQVGLAAGGGPHQGDGEGPAIGPGIRLRRGGGGVGNAHGAQARLGGCLPLIQPPGRNRPERRPGDAWGRRC